MKGKKMAKKNQYQCNKCSSTLQTKKDMEQIFTDLLLCDDCYTEVRYIVADYLNVNIQDLNL